MSNPENFNDYTVSGFVWNEAFRRWVLFPDKDADDFWNNWLRYNPEKAQAAGDARNIIAAMRVMEPEITKETIGTEIQRVLDKIDDSGTAGNETRRALPWLGRQWLVGIAASVLIVAAGIAIWLTRQQAVKATITYQELVTSAGEKLVEKVSSPEKKSVIMLPDNTRITMEKRSRISYSTSFNTLPERKVYLSGTARFDVAKNAAKPFLVYTDGLITKVLGTSFIIHSTGADKKVTVEVISGIVSVYSYIDKRPKEETNGKVLNTLILTANQEAKYSVEDKTLMASLVSDPVIVSVQQIDFRFEDAPIDSVFKSIEKAYGIDIIYDDKSLARRTFTAALTTETLYDKMDIVCKALNARYEIIDGKIVVYNNVIGQ